MEYFDGLQSACAIVWSTLTGDRMLTAIGWSTLTGDRMLTAIGWSTLTADTMFATIFFEYFRCRVDRFGRGMARVVAIWRS